MDSVHVEGRFETLEDKVTRLDELVDALVGIALVQRGAAEELHEISSRYSPSS